MLPVQVNGDYDVQVVFSYPAEPVNCAGVILPVASQQCGVITARDGSVLECLGGEQIILRRWHPVKEHRYTAVTKVPASAARVPVSKCFWTGRE